MRWRNRLLRWNFYFTRGKKWPDLAISLAMAVVLFWGFRSELPFLSDWFGSIAQFAVVFLIVYIFGNVAAGQVDTKHGTFQMETTVAALNSPWVRDLFKALSLIADGKTEEAKKLCGKWMKQ